MLQLRCWSYLFKQPAFVRTDGRMMRTGGRMMRIGGRVYANMQSYQQNRETVDFAAAMIAAVIPLFALESTAGGLIAGSRGASSGVQRCSVGKGAPFMGGRTAQIAGGRGAPNSRYTLDLPGMAPHTTGNLGGGKSQFLYQFNAEQATLDAASYADAQNLWTPQNRAKVIFDSPIGVSGKTGELTNVMNVYRTNTGYVHASPGN